MAYFEAGRAVDLTDDIIPTHPLTGPAGMSRMDGWPILTPIAHEASPVESDTNSAACGHNPRSFFEPDPVLAAEYFRRQKPVLP